MHLGTSHPLVCSLGIHVGSVVEDRGLELAIHLMKQAVFKNQELRLKSALKQH